MNEINWIKCNKCKDEFIIDNICKVNRSGKTGICRGCDSKYQRELYQKHKDKHKIKNANYRLNNPKKGTGKNCFSCKHFRLEKFCNKRMVIIESNLLRHKKCYEGVEIE